MDEKKYYRMLPNEAIKKAYGKIKSHKKHWPIRPIVSSLNTITSGAEEWILQLLSPLKDQCKYSLDSTKQFSEEFHKIQEIFDSNEYEIVSWDVCDMYTNVDTHVATDHIISIIYSNPENFFPEKTNPTNGETYRKIIPKPLLKKFLLSVLTKFTAFSSAGGFYRQIQGLSMGSKISGLISNIYMNIIESEIIDKEINNGNIKYFKRYVDDIVILFKKGTKNQIFDKMNNFCKDIKFTEDCMENNEMKFLDTIIYLNNEGKIHLKQHRKSEREVHNNFKLAIMPKNQKIGALCTEIYRANYTNSTKTDTDEALKKVKSIFLKNSYPEKLIDQKIKEIRARNFLPSADKIERQNMIRENQHKYFNLSLPYTSHACQKIGQKMQRLIKKFTPSFSLNLCWKSLRLSNHFSHKLKMHIPCLEKSGLVYSMKCVEPCSSVYIGETKRVLRQRITKHNCSPKKGQNPSAIEKHTKNSAHFKSALHSKF